MISTQALVLRIIRILHSLHTTEFWTRKGFTFVWTFVEKISTRSEIHLIYDSPVLTTPFLLRLRSYRRFSRMYNTRVRFACPIYFSRDQSSSKLIIFLDSKLERSNSRVAKIDSRLDSRNFRGSRIESRVEFRNSRVTVNLPLSGTVQYCSKVSLQSLVSRKTWLRARFSTLANFENRALSWIRLLASWL